MEKGWLEVEDVEEKRGGGGRCGCCCKAWEGDGTPL